MLILGIETSCDDTCVSVIEARGRKRPRFKILTNIVSSQTEVHKKYGGVYPSLAKREHEKNLVPVLLQALRKAKLLNYKLPAYRQAGKFPNYKQILNPKFQIPKPNIDAIAITIGPGLDPCLWAGANFAKELAKNWKLPIIPVNHIEAHILVNFVDQVQNSCLPAGKAKLLPAGRQGKTQNFPAIALIVSGGHTQLILIKNPPTGGGNYKIIGETRDDAAGECFDKVARILGLGYPGGPAIAAEAVKITNYPPTGRQANSRITNKLPRPMINQKNYDFSFSGLKTAVLYKVRSTKYEARRKKEFIQEMCKEVQQAVIDVLIKKTIRAAKEYNVKTIILGGGVSANQELRRQFLQKIQKEKLSFKFQVPSFKLSTDNAVMTAIAGYYNYLQGKTGKIDKIKAEPNLRINAKSKIKNQNAK